MKKQRLLFGIILTSFILLASNCKPEEEPPKDGTLQLQFELTNNGTPMAYNQVVSLAGMQSYKMDALRFYLSNIYLTIGTKEVFLADVMLADAATFGTAAGVYSYTVPVDSYESLKMGVGLDALQNASDPVTFPANHPLSIAQSMYWSWASKYRFERLDGRANETGNVGQANDLLLAYHPGADAFYSVEQFLMPINIEGGKTKTLTISLDVAAFFDGPGGTIDLPTEPQTHTGVSDYQIAEKFAANFAAAIIVK